MISMMVYFEKICKTCYRWKWLHTFICLANIGKITTCHTKRTNAKRREREVATVYVLADWEERGEHSNTSKNPRSFKSFRL